MTTVLRSLPILMCVALTACGELPQPAPPTNPDSAAPPATSETPATSEATEGSGVAETSETPSTPTPGKEPPPATTPPPTSCPEGMVRIPAGTYPFGDPDPTTEGWYRLKAGEVVLASFCIDRYEYPGLGELPRANVTWNEAAALCKKDSKRLCSEHEWVAACRGASGWPFAYGEAFEPNRCHTDGHDSIPQPIGGRSACSNPLGVHDLNGSLSEWVADAWDRAPLPPLDEGVLPDPTSPQRVLRGGTMWFAIYGQDCLSRHSHGTEEAHRDDGFRCCADP